MKPEVRDLENKDMPLTNRDLEANVLTALPLWPIARRG